MSGVVVDRGRVIADTSVKDLIATASGDRVQLRTAARTEAMTVLGARGGYRRCRGLYSRTGTWFAERHLPFDSVQLAMRHS
jgi:hypothetical protein